jgi:RsiW-degrading membrane proteinase PrsW (M82 family)
MSWQILTWLYFFSVVLPVFFWVWFFRRLDKKDPEPQKLLFKVFRYGFGAVVAALFAGYFVDRVFFPDLSKFFDMDMSGDVDWRLFSLVAMSFFLAGPIEEILKYLALKFAIFKNSQFNQIADGIVYGTVLALGFAFIENSGYFLDAYWNFPQDEFVVVVFIRGIMTTMLHVVATGIMGFFVARSKFLHHDHSRGVYKGVLIASLLHGLYNVFAFFWWGMLLNVFMILVAGRYLVGQIKKKEVQHVWRSS